MSAAEAEQARRDAMWAEIAEHGGFVYDSAGNLIGTVGAARVIEPTGISVRIEP